MNALLISQPLRTCLSSQLKQCQRISWRNLSVSVRNLNEKKGEEEVKENIDAGELKELDHIE